MQRRTPFLLVIGSLVLSSCGGGLLGGPQSGPDVSGSFIGAWPGSGTKLALVGVTDKAPYTVNDNSSLKIVDATVTKSFLLDLPVTANNGFYRVIAFVDGSNGKPADGKYQIGETVDQGNGKYLIYSDGTFQAFNVTVGKGWNLYNNADGTVKPRSSVANDTFTGYDLTYPSNP